MHQILLICCGLHFLYALFSLVKKRFWRAADELILVQAEFANISFGSIGHNLKFSSWEWDDIYIMVKEEIMITDRELPHREGLG